MSVGCLIPDRSLPDVPVYGFGWSANRWPSFLLCRAESRVQRISSAISHLTSPTPLHFSRPRCLVECAPPPCHPSTLDGLGTSHSSLFVAQVLLTRPSNSHIQPSLLCAHTPQPYQCPLRSPSAIPAGSRSHAHLDAFSSPAPFVPSADHGIPPSPTRSP